MLIASATLLPWTRVLDDMTAPSTGSIRYPELRI